MSGLGFTTHELHVWDRAVQALQAFAGPQDTRRSQALARVQACLREADRRHTPEEIAAAERALGVA